MEIQIHGQKINIRSQIAVTEAGIELKAIENIDTVSKTNISHMQVAVAISYLSGF